MDAASFGQNAYFYDAAEGLLTATILLVAEFCAPEKRHIVSVFKVIQELLAPSKKKGKNQQQGEDFPHEKTLLSIKNKRFCHVQNTAFGAFCQGK